MSRFDAEAMLAEQVIGRLVRPGDPDYDTVSEVFNERCAGRPVAIMRCMHTDDVRTALAWARTTDTSVAVRGGGHSIAGWSSAEGCLIIDLGAMRGIEIDGPAATAWVGGGVRAGDLLDAAAEVGLTAVTGATPEVGLGGLLLGLGEGYLTPKHGFGVDNVLALEVVTANGRVLQVSALSHPELFWAMRGAGANFGVVTRFKLRLHPLPERAVGGSITFDHTQIARATRHVWSVMAGGSEHYWPYAVYELDVEGRPQLRVIPGHTGPSAVAAAEVDALRRCAVPATDDIRDMTYLSMVQDMGAPSTDPIRPRRHAWELRRFPFAEDPQRQTDRLLELTQSLTDTAQFVLWRTIAKHAPEDSGVAPRHAGITLCISDSWHNAAEDDRHLDWSQQTTDRLREDGITAIPANAVNHAQESSEERGREVYGDRAYERLALLKKLFDPENRFHHNFNVRPAGTG